MIERNQRLALSDVKGRRSTAGQAQKRAAVLFESGDVDRSAVSCTEHGRASSSKNECAVEGIGIEIVDQKPQSLHAELDGMCVVANQQIVIHLDVTLMVARLARSGPSSGEGARDLQAGRRREWRLIGIFPGEGEAALVQERRAQRRNIGNAQIMFVYCAVVAGLRQRLPTHSLIGQRTHIGHISNRQGIAGIELPIGARAGNPQPLGIRNVIDQVFDSVLGVQYKGIHRGEAVDVPLFEIKRKIALALLDGAAQLESVSPLADGGAGDRQGIFALTLASLSLKNKAPWYVSCPGLVKISMRPPR